MAIEVKWNDPLISRGNEMLVRTGFPQRLREIENEIVVQNDSLAFRCGFAMAHHAVPVGNVAPLNI